MKMFRLLIGLTILCGVLYPVTVTFLGKVFFPKKLNGSLIYLEGKLVGSGLLSQQFTQSGFFHPRPSASNYATIPSGGSQFSPTNKMGSSIIKERRKEYPQAGIDFWTSSGSGLDPHISPETAYSQAARIAATRSLSLKEVNTLIDRSVENQTWGIWGRPRLNVLKLNIELLSQGKNANSR